MKRKITCILCLWTMVAWRPAAERMQIRRAQQQREASALVEAFQRGFSPACPEEIEQALSAFNGISIPNLLVISYIARSASLRPEAEADQWGHWSRQIWQYTEYGIVASGVLTGWGWSATKEESQAACFTPLYWLISTGTILCGAAAMMGRYFSHQVKTESETLERLAVQHRMYENPLAHIILAAFQRNPTLRFSSQQVDRLMIRLMQRPQGLIVE